MQVLMGPTYNMGKKPACEVRERSTSSVVPASAAQDNNNNNKVVSITSSLFFNGYEDADENDVVGDQYTFGSSDDSSIGVPGDSEEEEEDDVVSSSKEGVGLPSNKFSMDSLEDSLPTKRGLSNHYSGKSVSFGNLTEAMSMSMGIKDLEKKENLFNKRRRLLIAKRKLFYSRRNPKSMPQLPILPDHVDEEDEEEEEDDQRQVQEQQGEYEQLHGNNKLQLKMGFKSESCFCLADLAEEEDD